MFKKYNQEIREILIKKAPDADWKKILSHHQRMILRIQHERLIHLLVTIFVGLVGSIASFITIVTQKPDLLIFTIPLLVLFIAYLFHYRFLENTTQGWYKLEEEIILQLNPVVTTNL
jgi:hypothetical protein